MSPEQKAQTVARIASLKTYIDASWSEIRDLEAALAADRVKAAVSLSTRDKERRDRMKPVVDTRPFNERAERDSGEAVAS